MTSPKYRVAILISGRGSNMLRILEERAQLEGEFVGVLSSDPSAAGLARAAELGVPVASVDSSSFSSRADFDAALVAQLDEWGADFLVLAGFMRILTDELVDSFAGRIVNIHPSLLPSFPGLHAQRQAIEAGARVSGCTVHFVATGEVDTGPIIAQASVPISFEDTEATLAKRIQVAEHELFPAALREVLSGALILKDGRVVRS